jgi:hypothetical protein
MAVCIIQVILIVPLVQSCKPLYAENEIKIKVEEETRKKGKKEQIIAIISMFSVCENTGNKLMMIYNGIIDHFINIHTRLFLYNSICTITNGTPCHNHAFGV